MDYTKLPNYAKAVEKYTNAVAEGAEEKEQQKLFANMMAVMGSEIVENLSEQTSNKISDLMSSKAGTSKMSADEVKFFDAVSSGLGNAETTLPLEIINQVFVELTYAHPILNIIKFQSTGLSMRAITSDGIYNGGNAGWGTFTAAIQNQLEQAFHQHDFSQNKLTAYIVIPKDALQYSYEWLKTFVTLQLSEAIAVALETALISGDGNQKLVGLTKDATVVNGTTTYADKEVLADLTGMTPETSPALLAPVMQKLSINEKEVPVNISGNTYIAVSPFDYYTFLKDFMYLTLDGTFSENLPYGLKVIQCMAVPKGKAVVFAANRYWGYMGGMTLQEFDQTFALEDLQLYTSKSFYYGVPYDNNTAAVVTITATTEETDTPS